LAAIPEDRGQEIAHHAKACHASADNVISTSIDQIE
jgi:hypothetical protein